MIQYVLGIVTSPERDVLLIRKTKPDWQAGRLNGIGGKIEIGEAPGFAMAREFREETGCVSSLSHPVSWSLKIRLTHPPRDSLVYFFHACLPRKTMLECVNTEGKGEELEVMKVDEAIRKVRLMDNLRWMIPMFMDQAIQSHPLDIIYSE